MRLRSTAAKMLLYIKKRYGEALWGKRAVWPFVRLAEKKDNRQERCEIVAGERAVGDVHGSGQRAMRGLVVAGHGMEQSTEAQQDACLIGQRPGGHLVLWATHLKISRFYSPR